MTGYSGTTSTAWEQTHSEGGDREEHAQLENAAAVQ